MHKILTLGVASLLVLSLLTPVATPAQPRGQSSDTTAVSNQVTLDIDLIDTDISEWVDNYVSEKLESINAALDDVFVKIGILDPPTSTQTTANASITLSQKKDTVGYLGSHHFSDTRGHNTLTADVDHDNAQKVWVEMSINGSSYEPMQRFTESDFKQPIEQSPDGTVISDISHRESIAMRYQNNSQDRIVVLYGRQNSQDIVWLESPNADPTTLSNPTVVHQDSVNAEDPSWIVNKSSGQMYMYYESDRDPNLVEVWEADTHAGKSYSNNTTIGGTHWDNGITFASPRPYTYNGEWYLSGEEHDTSDGDLMVAKGTGAKNWNDYKIVANASAHDDISNHINMQDVYIDRHGRLHAYSSNKLTSGDWVTQKMTTNNFDAAGYPRAPWSIGPSRSSLGPVGMFRTFNGMYVYGANSSTSTDLVYWRLGGTKMTKPLPDGGATRQFEYYEPTAPRGATISWRVAVKLDNGTVVRSDAKQFQIAG